MNKNYKRIAITLAVLILGYLNYYKEEEGLGVIKNVIETTNVSYSASGYEILAQTQIDDMDLETTKFLKASVDYKDLNLRGDKVFLDVGKNLFLEDNIIGHSGDEWELRANEVSYNQYKDILSTKSGIEAVNLLKKINFKSQELKTNKEFDKLELNKNVEMTNEKIKITGNKGKYSKENESFILVGEGKFNNFDKEDPVSGKFINGRYLLSLDEILTEDGFEINFKEGKLVGKNLYFNNGTKSFVSTNNPQITLESYIIDASEIRKEPEENIVKFIGNIKGQGDDLSFIANKGYYDLDTETFYLDGNIEVTTKKGEVIKADRVEYNTVKKLAKVSSKTYLTYSFEDAIIKSRDMLYNYEKENIIINSPYTYETPVYISEGQSLVYNQGLKTGDIINGYILTKENKDKLSANNISFDLDKKDYRASEEVKLETSSLILETSSLDYLTSEDRGYMKDVYVLTNKKDGSKLESKNAQYLISAKEVKSDEAFNYKTKSGIIEGKGLVYNTATEEGSILSQVKYLDEDGNIITGDKGSYKNSEYFEIKDNVKVSLKDDEILTSKVKYLLSENEIVFEEKISFKNKNNEFSGDLLSAKVDNSKNLFIGETFQGKTSKNENISSKNLVYNLGTKEIKLLTEVKLEGSEYILTSDSLTSRLDTDIIRARGRVKLKYGNEGEVLGQELEINNKTNDISGNNIKFVSSDSNSIEANNFNGNMKTLKFNFKNNVRGNLNSGEDKLKLSGEDLEVLFENKDGKNRPKNIIGKKNTKIITDIYTFASNNIKYDFITSDLVSDSSTRVYVDDKETKTTLNGGGAKGNLKKGLINFVSKIKVENKDKKGKITTLVGDSGILNSKSKTIELKSNVVLENEDLIFKTDRMIYNKNTEKVKAYGKTNITYKDSKGENL